MCECVCRCACVCVCVCVCVCGRGFVWVGGCVGGGRGAVVNIDTSIRMFTCSHVCCGLFTANSHLRYDSSSGRLTADLLCTNLQRFATLCSTLQHSAAHWNTLQHSAAHCNALQHTATLCKSWRMRPRAALHEFLSLEITQHTATHCNTLQRTATLYNTLQHTAARCNP